MVEQKGVYRGYFLNGKKEGKGIFEGVNGITYEGDYKGNKKHGFGKIKNTDNSIAYKGEMKDDIPHGKGKAYTGGKAEVSYWQEGIDCRLLLDTIGGDHV